MRRIGGLVLAAMLASTTMEDAMAFDLTLTRVVNAPQQQVWAALTEAEIIAEWWGPAGFTAPKVEADFRIGGATVVCMTAPGFPLLCNTWTYTEIVEGERIAFDQGWADEDGHVIDPDGLGLPADIPAVVPHVLALRALDDGRTELSWSEFGYASQATAEQSRLGLESVLDKLVASLE
jgi:uncharacterized protein YndB with AHSA1/START domain